MFLCWGSRQRPRNNGLIVFPWTSKAKVSKEMMRFLCKKVPKNPGTPKRPGLVQEKDLPKKTSAVPVSWCFSFWQPRVFGGNLVFQALPCWMRWRSLSFLKFLLRRGPNVGELSICCRKSNKSPTYSPLYTHLLLVGKLFVLFCFLRHSGSFGLLGQGAHRNTSWTRRGARRVYEGVLWFWGS